MDWKDVLAGKVAEGALPEREEYVPKPCGEASYARGTDTLTVTLDRKGRKGKTATIVEGFTCSDAEVAEVAARLKKMLGTGGSARGGEILMQGDCASKLKDTLRTFGYRVK